MTNRITYDHPRRLETLLEVLDRHALAGAVLSRSEHIFYFTGFTPTLPPVFLLVTPRHTIAVAPSPIGEHETILYTDYDIYSGWSIVANASEALHRAMEVVDLKGRHVGIESGHLPAAFMATIAPGIGESCNLEDMIWKMRRIKDDSEIAKIEDNVRGNDRMFEAVRQAVRPGISELELWSVIYQTMCENAGEPISLQADVGAGLRTSNPDVRPGHDRLAAGDSILVDVYSATHGYYADTTRNFVLGRPTRRQLEIHAILEEALAAGGQKLAPGVRASDVDAAVRGVVEQAGYGHNFPHHAGHSYGVFQQERPYLIPADTLPLEPGMILTIEPGIYIDNWGGMRLEGNYVITENGARRLDCFPAKLIEC